MSIVERTETDWTRDHPWAAALDGATRELLRAHARPVAVPAGSIVFREGSPCQNLMILVSGRLRVQKTGENGREIVLYRVEPGDTCVVTVACLMASVDYDAEGVAETDIEARAVPVAGFRDLLARSAGFREAVFRAFGARIADLLMLIDEVAFGRIDQRLASHLLSRAGGRDRLETTHQQLAVELGTAREVVSRQIKEFERKGWVVLSRGSVQIADREALAVLGKG